MIFRFHGIKKIHKRIRGFYNRWKIFALAALIIAPLVIVCDAFYFYKIQNNEIIDIEFLQNYYSLINSATESGVLRLSEQNSSFVSAPRVFLASRPKTIKAIYLSAWSAGRDVKIEEAIEMAKATEINAVVIDIKDRPGLISYDTDIPEVDKYNAEMATIRDVRGGLDRLHNEGIYTIGRIAVFSDSALARARPDLAIHKKTDKSSLWQDRAGSAWLDCSSREVWDYNIVLAKDALSQGFDEINFDYIRFPSDGNLQNMDFPFYDEITPRSVVMREFFKYIREAMAGSIISADVFGLTTVNTDDLGIGQIIESAFEYFDFVCPMVYPSHYRSGFLEYQNPNEHPYEVIKHCLNTALQRLNNFNQLNGTSAKLRPWLQDFSLGGVLYDKEMVEAEIKAVYDAMGDDFCGFMLWNPRNVYTIEAFGPEQRDKNPGF